MDRAAVATLVYLLFVGSAVTVAWGAAALSLFFLFAIVAVAMVIFVPGAGGWWENASRGRFRYREPRRR